MSVLVARGFQTFRILAHDNALADALAELGKAGAGAASAR